MKTHHPTLPTKREPVRKGVLRRLHAITKNRKQRVAATAGAGDFDVELPGRKIGMALAVIVGVHVVAAGLVFFHHWRLEGRGGDAVASTPSAAPALLSPGNAAVPKRPADQSSHVVSGNETYQSIAARYKVEESALRAANPTISGQIRPGQVLDVPSKKIVALESPEVMQARVNDLPDNRGIIEPPKATIVPESPKLVKPTVSRATAENFHAVEHKPAAEETPHASKKDTKGANSPKSDKPKSSKSYTVKEGDSLSKIAIRLKVDPDQLRKANGISDVKKLKPGMTLSIPN